ncbi:pyridoxal phosphate-dependent aminotransferase [bacterium]|nr:pyridoxal phosphate-dependent aminotransferase [bacterium]
MPATASRLSVFTESVIRGTTRLANQHGAINLAQGFPDFDPPEELLAALERATRGPHHQYAVTWGAPRFREALARKITHFTGLPIDPDLHLVVTCGSTEAMMVAMMTACNPGDKVIIFSPFYENYAADAILSGAEPIYVPLRPPGFGFDSEELARAFAQKPKAIVVCNPSNPTGKVFTREELMEILRLAEQHDAFVITDEPYEHIGYAPHEHVYVMLDISSLGFATDTEASEWLIRDIGVAGVAGSSFFREPVNHLIRFHFAKSAATLQAAGERLLRLA